MKTSLLLVLVTGLSLVLTAGSCLQGKHVVGSKNYISQEVKADHFNEIKLLGSANISYHQDTRSHVEIHGSDNIIPLVETYVDGNTLMIKFKKNVSIWKGKLEIKVFAPELNKLSINGSGNIKLINGIQTSKDIEFHINGSGNIQGEGLNCRRMAVSINGSGDVRLQQIESQECQAGISGSGNINLKGKAIQAKYAIAGSGNIQAADLEAENTDASISKCCCLFRQSVPFISDQESGSLCIIRSIIADTSFQMRCIYADLCVLQLSDRLMQILCDKKRHTENTSHSGTDCFRIVNIHC